MHHVSPLFPAGSVCGPEFHVSQSWHQSSVLTLYYDSDVDVITSQRMSGRFSLSVKFDKMRNIKILSHSSGWVFPISWASPSKISPPSPPSCSPVRADWQDHQSKSMSAGPCQLGSPPSPSSLSSAAPDVDTSSPPRAPSPPHPAPARPCLDKNSRHNNRVRVIFSKYHPPPISILPP